MGKSLLYEFYIEFIPKCNQALLTETADVCLIILASGGDIGVVSSTGVEMQTEHIAICSLFMVG